MYEISSSERLTRGKLRGGSAAFRAVSLRLTDKSLFHMRLRLHLRSGAGSVASDSYFVCR